MQLSLIKRYWAAIAVLLQMLDGMLAGYNAAAHMLGGALNAGWPWGSRWAVPRSWMAVGDGWYPGSWMVVGQPLGGTPIRCEG